MRFVALPERFEPRFAPIFGGLADTDASGRYLPSPDQILATPTAGAFYQVKQGDLPIRIAAKAYGDAAKKAGLYAFNAATWNDTARKASTGYEAYKMQGIQFVPKYSGPRTKHGSGNRHLVLWLPPIGGGEPESFYPSAPVPTPVPRPQPKTKPRVPPLAPREPAPAQPKTAPKPAKKPATRGPTDYADGRYIPTRDQVVTKPTPGLFYRPKQGDVPIRMMATAYGAANKKAGIYLFAGSTWNDHIRKTSTGYEAYKIKGPQLTPHYADHPRAPYKSGPLQPIAWIPPVTGEEPEIWFSRRQPTPATPATPKAPTKPGAKKPKKPAKPAKPTAPATPASPSKPAVPIAPPEPAPVQPAPGPQQPMIPPPYTPPGPEPEIEPGPEPVYPSGPTPPGPEPVYPTGPTPPGPEPVYPTGPTPPGPEPMYPPGPTPPVSVPSGPIAPHEPIPVQPPIAPREPRTGRPSILSAIAPTILLSILARGRL